MALGCALVVALLVLAVAPSALAGNPSSGSLELTLEPPAAPAADNKPIVLRGSVTPAQPGIEIALQRAEGAGKALVTTTTEPDGSFSEQLSLKQPTTVIARAIASGALSGAVTLALRPKLTVKVGKVAAFTDATTKLTVDPHGATGTATITVKRNGKTVQTTRTKLRKGRGSAKIVAPGPGAYVVLLEFDAPNGFAAASANTTARATTRVLKLGWKGRDVAGLIRKIASLKFHAPDATQAFNASLHDSVIAFQKVAGLPRTGVMGKADWVALTRARPVTPTQSGPANRIEVDKTRQILIKVRGGKVAGVLPVSTGATGNTPKGVHNIRWKAPTTTTWLGPGILYRTLTFFGNAFAIHGRKSVPAYAASAGCVRVPIWTADWLYDRSPVGETVIVHR